MTSSVEAARPKAWFAANLNSLLAAPVLLAALGVYWFSAVLAGHTQTPDMAYFNDLANAFLHGQLYLPNPAVTHDLTQFNGNWYVPFPPLPALLLMPWVALSGVSQVNTVLFAAVMGAFNVALAFLLLQGLSRRGWSQLRTSDNLWLTLLFGAGTVQWYMATQGTVWYVSQICTATFLLASAWIAVAKRSPLLAGAALALAMLARPNVALFYPFLAGVGLEWIRAEEDRQNLWRRWLRWCVLAALPVIVSVGLLLGYNYARFQNVLDFGYAHENVASKLKSDLRDYGQFNVHYIGRNIWSMLLSWPTWDPRTNSVSPDPDGMSLLLVSPALLYLFKVRKKSPLVIGAWVALGLMVILLLLYYNTGWMQFGYRFSLDFMTLVLVLLAVGAGQRIRPMMKALIVLSVLINLWGVYWFNTYSLGPQGAPPNGPPGNPPPGGQPGGPPNP
jgi:hypothetical protein